MKHFLLTTIASALLAVTGFSQITLKPGIGMNWTDFTKQGNGNTKAKVGYQVGGSIQFGNQFYFEPGVYYMGTSTQYTNQNQPVNYNLMGVRVPLSIGVNLIGDQKKNANLHVFGGGSAFFVTHTGTDVPKSDINATFWGLHAGAGVDIYLFYLDASYEWSLTNVQRDVSEFDLGKKQTLFITAGIRIPLHADFEPEHKTHENQ